MLTRLYIENIAVIERAELDLHAGLNVLTGETGAGKSMVIDAINAVLGERIGRDAVRTGCDAAHVTALFEELSPATVDKLRVLGYEPDEDGLLIQRSIAVEGRSSCSVGGRPTTAAVLREVGRLLINIHGQHDNQTLLHAETHLGYLDRWGGLAPLQAAYETAYRRYCTIYKDLKKESAGEDEKAQRADLLRFQIDELTQAAIQAGEEQALEQKRLLCRNAEKTLAALRKTETALCGGEQRTGAVAELEAAQKALRDAGKTLPQADELARKLQAMLYDLQDSAEQIKDMTRQLDFDDYTRDQVEERLDLLHRLGVKYGKTTADMLAYLAKAQSDLQAIETSDERIQVLQQQLIQAESVMTEKAAELTAARRRTAASFAELVKNELTFLDMPQVTFIADVQPTTLTALGGDKVEFLLSANVGEPPKPLTKIASGGELSRIMLAIKSVMADADDIDTLVFDEIDTGISGRAAQKVGQKLRQTAAGGKRQILCVTHLASIAAQAHNHLFISKEVRDGRTYTTVQPLKFQQRAEELARLIGGSITEASLAAAGEMLHNAQ